MKSERLHFRGAVLADAPALAKCIEAAYAKYLDRIPDMPSVSDGVPEDIENNQVWVCEENETVIAGLFLVPQEGFLKLANLAVHPGHGGKGIGRKLMALAEAEALRQGYSEMRLNTHAAMPENVQLYAHWGWEKTAQSGNTVSMRKCFERAE